jgi:hypothetical protein
VETRKKTEAATGWPKGNERILEIERGRTRSHSVKSSLWKWLWTYRRTDYGRVMPIATTMVWRVWVTRGAAKCKHCLICLFSVSLNLALSGIQQNSVMTLLAEIIFSLWGRLRLKCDGTRAETRLRFSAKRTSPFKSAGESVQSTTGSRGVRISGGNAGYTMSRGSVKSTGYLLHSPVSPSLPPPLRRRVASHFNRTLRSKCRNIDRCY